MTHHAHRAPANENHRVYETRYRTHEYFLEDQLRFSDAVSDFRTVKNLLAQAPQFNLRRAFYFTLQPVAIGQDA